jgi:hypothetical protein
MESKIEEIKIVINENLEPRSEFQFDSLQSILSKDLYARVLRVEKKIYHCSSDLTANKYVPDLEGLTTLQGYYKAYVKHIPICITPDILWMLIIQGFSRHIDINSEKLRSKLVQFQGKKTLFVDGDEKTIEDITKEGWERTFNEFVEKIRSNVGGLMINLLTPCFTTTTPTIQVASQIAIMSAFKNYFRYVRFFGGCGFPYIKLQGTLLDYMQLKFKIQGLIGYEIDDWVKELITIVDKIIETKQGNIDKQFWENILKNVEVVVPYGSGELTKITKLDGWLLNFYPFKKVCYNKIERLERRNNFNQPLLIDEEIRKFPEELIDVPLTMVNKETGEPIELSVKTGIIGMVQEEDGVAKAEIGWFVTNKIDIEKAKRMIPVNG